MFNLDQLNTLSQLDLGIAQYIVSYPEKVAYMRIHELAAQTHTSPSSIMRFTKHVGFTSFPELRLHIRESIANQRNILSSNSYAETFANNQSFTPDFEQALEQLANAINNADVIHCIGLGASGAVAEYAASHLKTLGYYSFVSKESYFPYINLYEQQAGRPLQKKNRPKELCLLFSVSGGTTELIQMAQVLKNEHIMMACVTSNSASRLAQLADLSVTYDTSYDRIHYNADLSSQLPVIFIIETLIRTLINNDCY